MTETVGGRVKVEKRGSLRIRYVLRIMLEGFHKEKIGNFGQKYLVVFIFGNTCYMQAIRHCSQPWSSYDVQKF